MHRDPPAGRILLLLMAALASVQCATQPTHAIDTDTSAERHQVDQLNERLNQLEQRVMALEQHDTAAATPAQTSPGTQKGEKPHAPTTNPSGIAPPEAWQSVHSDLSAGEVRKLLGEPARRFQLGNRLVWYYVYPGVGRGSVMFDQSGHVVDWQRPPFSWW